MKLTQLSILAMYSEAVGLNYELAIQKQLFAYQSKWLWHITVIATMYIHGLPDMYTLNPRPLGVCAYQASQSYIHGITLMIYA